MFHVPNKNRVRIGMLASQDSCGNNGAFQFEFPHISILVIAMEGEGWERAAASTAVRCPTWEEMCFIKRIFWDPEDAVMQLHPPESDYVNIYPYCLHLWRPTNCSIPLPPSRMVGVKGAEK